jgi:hypothetical protein
MQSALKAAQLPKVDPLLAQKINSSKKEVTSFGSALWNEIKKDLGIRK